MAIRAALIFNNHGKPRLTKFYAHANASTSRQQALIQKTFTLIHKRTTQQQQQQQQGGSNSINKEVCNFLDAPELKEYLPKDQFASLINSSTLSQGINDVKSSNTIQSQSLYDEDVDVQESKQSITKSNNGKSFTNSTTLKEDQLRVIYRHYATLYFVFIVDEAESELGILDLIQVFVESLDREFENVCELDLIFHFEKVHEILDLIIQGGLVLETDIEIISNQSKLIENFKKQSFKNSTFQNATSLSSSAIQQIGQFSGISSSTNFNLNNSSNSIPSFVQDWTRDWTSRFSNSSRAGGSSFSRIGR